MGLTRLLGGVTGITNQPQGLDIGLSGSNIKSIQRGSRSFTNSTGPSITINSVDVSKSIVKITYRTNGVPTNNRLNVGAELTSSTNLQLSTDTADVSYTTVVEWEVIEFNNVKSRQFGWDTQISSSRTVTISAIDPNKSAIFVSASNTDSTAGGPTAYAVFTAKINNSTQIAFDSYSASTGIRIRWQVIEFN